VIIIIIIIIIIILNIVVTIMIAPNNPIEAPQVTPTLDSESPPRPANQKTECHIIPKVPSKICHEPVLPLLSLLSSFIKFQPKKVCFFGGPKFKTRLVKKN